MRRTRTDPTKIDLSIQCPACGYRIQPHEVMWVDGERIHCPHCDQDVVILGKGKGTAPPAKQP